MEVKLNEHINGFGLYATKSYSKSEIVYVLNGPISIKPSKYTIRIGDNQHILDKRGRYMNHSFDPTTYIDHKNVIAATDINSGDELNFNYNASEVDMACPFVVDGVEVSGKICQV